MVSLRLPDSEEYIEARGRGLETGLGPTRASNTTSRRLFVNSLLVDFVMDALVANSTPSSSSAAVSSSSVALDAHNTTVNQTYPHLLYRHSIAMTIVFCIAYLIVFIVGLIGNCFVIMVVYRSPRMRNVTNFFIVNLAVADILVIVFCLPATLMSNIFVRKYNNHIVFTLEFLFFFFVFSKILK
ncbi:hypothetical protein O3M35_009828 [Rhynocoris fuscipes]|uniref:G-protein coupled receptors family 1 profile domain-containing protein n=1 Tax=Rhynocoris fuscipes TaxID=488301 RepID=A0AAW1D539_9HEMI